MSYTELWNRSYEQWIEERAKRIRSYLEICFERGEEIDLFTLTQKVYYERLNFDYSLRWRPYENQFQDFKPSPFIRNYLLFVIERLRELGFIKAQFELQITDSLTLSESFQEESTSSSNSNNQEIVRVIPHYYVREVPSLELLKSLAFQFDNEIEAFRERLSRVTTIEEYEQFLKENDYQR